MVTTDLAAAQVVAVFMARASVQVVAVFMARAIQVVKASIISNLARAISNSSNSPGIKVTQNS